MPIHRLPMMRDRTRIFADQIRREFLDGGGDGFGPAFEDRFAQASDAGIGVDFQKQPAGLDQKGFHLRDFDFISDTNHRLGVFAANLALVLLELLQVILARFAAWRTFGPGKLQAGGGGSSRCAEGFHQERAPIERPVRE